MASIAACIIVKNEEEYLPYCLGSIKDYCEEIVVVDSGSNDRTIDIARAFGATIIIIEWKNDFSFARNIAHASVQSEWILWADADEAFTKHDMEKIKHEYCNLNADFLALDRVNFWKDLDHMFMWPDTQYKLYRNSGYVWKNAIHEIIYDVNNPEHRGKVKHVDSIIYHYAYMKSAQDVQKKMAHYIQIENPSMNFHEIDACSTQHSFFKENMPPEVSRYQKGVYPEIFSTMKIENGCIYNNGQLILDKNKIQQKKKKISGKNNIGTNNLSNIRNNRIFKYDSIYDLTSIVIATYNKVEYLKPCIESIIESTDEFYELIVVNNGSTEQNVLDYLLPLEATGKIRLVNSYDNLGFARGYNRGVQEARGQYICCINNDTLVTQNWIKKFKDAYKTKRKIGVIGPISNRNPSEHGTIAGIDPNASFGEWVSAVEQLNGELKESSWVTGLCIFFERILCEKLQTIQNPKQEGILFHEIYEVGQEEDTHLQFAINHRLGLKNYILQSNFIYHHAHATLNSVGDRNEIQIRNKEILKSMWPEIFKS